MNDFSLLEEEVLNFQNEITFVSAVAGGGKTTLIIKKILQLIIKGVNPQKIFVITYTNEAVNEIKNRLKKRFFEWEENDEKLFQDIVFFEKNEISDSPDSFFEFIKKKSFKLKNECSENQIENFLIKKIAKNKEEENFYKKSKFSNYISFEIFQKLKSLINEEIKVSTFHSFCFEFLKKFSKDYRFFEIKIINQFEKEFLISNLIEEEYLNFSFFKFGFSKNQIKRILMKIIDSEINQDFVFQNKEFQDKSIFIDDEKIKNFLCNLDSTNLSKTEQNFLKDLNFFINEKFFHEKQKIISYFEIFFTKDFEIRKSLIKILEKNSEISDFIDSEIKFLQENLKNIIFSELVLFNKELKNFSLKIKKNFQEYKKKNKIFEFDEIISDFHDLISNSNEKENFLFQLKKIFDHLILDEAQDNSEKQWEIIKILADEIFHKTENQINEIYDFLNENQDFSEKEMKIQEFLQNEALIFKKKIYERKKSSNFRSIFIVGDVKQSIYGFQNASPELFLESKKYFEEKSKLYNVKFKFINWNFCFRIGQKNLNFIDKYFNENKITNELFESQNLCHFSLSKNSESDFLVVRT